MFQLLIALGLVALASASPLYEYEFKTDNIDVEKKGSPGNEVEGQYKWIAPNGEEYYITYTSGVGGFQVVDDNVLPEIVEVPARK